MCDSYGVAHPRRASSSADRLNDDDEDDDDRDDDDDDGEQGDDDDDDGEDDDHDEDDDDDADDDDDDDNDDDDDATVWKQVATIWKQIATVSPETQFSLVYDTWPLAAPGMETSCHDVGSNCDCFSRNPIFSSLRYLAGAHPRPVVQISLVGPLPIIIVNLMTQTYQLLIECAIRTG